VRAFLPACRYIAPRPRERSMYDVDRVQLSTPHRPRPGGPRRPTFGRPHRAPGGRLAVCPSTSVDGQTSADSSEAFRGSRDRPDSIAPALSMLSDRRRYVVAVPERISRSTHVRTLQVAAISHPLAPISRPRYRRALDCLHAYCVRGEGGGRPGPSRRQRSHLAAHTFSLVRGASRGVGYVPRRVSYRFAYEKSRRMPPVHGSETRSRP
jgi:hypothetical protein